MKIKEAIKFFKDILFPIFCLECGKEGEWWCDECLSRRNFPPVLKCPSCGAATPSGRVCASCGGGCFLDGAVALTFYNEGEPPAELIKLLKYKYAEETVEVWRKIFQKVFGDTSRLPPPLQELVLNEVKEGGEGEVFVPVPLHPRRERERGFNQAAVLSRVFVEEIKKSGRQAWLLENALSRCRYTSQQTRLDKEARAKNMSGAFVWTGQSPCPAKVLLVDDVFTTGATLRECAAVLKSAGAKEVWALTVGRVE